MEPEIEPEIWPDLVPGLKPVMEPEIGPEVKPNMEPASSHLLYVHPAPPGPKVTFVQFIGRSKADTEEMQYIRIRRGRNARRFFLNSHGLTVFTDNHSLHWEIILNIGLLGRGTKIRPGPRSRGCRLRLWARVLPTIYCPLYSWIRSSARGPGGQTGYLD